MSAVAGLLVRQHMEDRKLRRGQWGLTDTIGPMRGVDLLGDADQVTCHVAQLEVDRCDRGFTCHTIALPEIGGAEAAS